MKCGKNYFEEGKSSFLSLEKDFALIANKILKNDRLCKMLYYTQADCLKADNLTMIEKQTMINKQIKIVPQLEITKDCPIFIIITFDNFTPNATNPEFRDCMINIDILCHPDHWNMGNFQLRPYKIAGEIDSMLDGKRLTGIGKVDLVSGNNLLLNDQLMGLSLMYKAVHGIEDEINPLS